MRAYNTVYSVIFPLELRQEADCESALTIAAMDNQLRNPTDILFVTLPTAGKRISSKLAINGNSDIGALAFGWETLSTKAILAHFHPATYTLSVDAV